ncbi:rRNA maturation RNase YbeY [Buchnera aphidicola (Brachycaudus cardui)]|uniref:Endoribonuclease YbeY n=1 Tax=Buchnera aphidicola (Brachycaudus cardui) TaxID=557993 RepID=A0A4D6XSH6_9GAMM|nr:rRNA maturation RNase YbeY [Buchnera aphidicola]QCI20572.1 rRNA maturation RNase YbeY [Buchnera aphidicola (Brachycaudus cardui)]
MKKIIINLQCSCIENQHIPQKYLFKKWIQKILYVKKNNIITIRIVNELEIKYLNYIYRGQNKATNVLSFPFNKYVTINYKLLGDLVLCKKIIEKEASRYNKKLESHWAHMTIHGVLHLLGYNHKNIKEAYMMEKIENKIMLSLNYKQPHI